MICKNIYSSKLKNINNIDLNCKKVNIIFQPVYYSKNILLQLNDVGMWVFRWRQSLMSNPKMIKTTCGIDKYHQLKRDKSLWGKLRFTWFVVIATLRDLKK